MEAHSPWSGCRNARVTEKLGSDKSHVLGASWSAGLKAYIHCSNRAGQDCVTLPNGREGQIW
uniref:Uncharacterized protein n=1 Tax=Oryza sativa subsp. japonica TaxID=39947 RepID=Q6ERF5_ORYSJ|nr:hypothetical protein [Oryza sativa Japonica Group]